MKPDDIVELTDCVSTSYLATVIRVERGWATIHRLFQPEGKLLTAQVPTDGLRVIKQKEEPTPQLSFPFMHVEDNKLDGYINQRLRKEESEWNRLHRQPGTKIASRFLTEEQIISLVESLESKGKSKEEIRKVIDDVLR